jgi:K+-sensing histidine kinase KdpD
MSFSLNPLSSLGTELSLETLISMVVKSSVAETSAKEMVIRTTNLEGIPIHGSENLLIRTLKDVFKFALIGSPEKSVLEISAEQNKDEVHIIFRDSGVGIHRRFEEYLFNSIDQAITDTDFPESQSLSFLLRARSLLAEMGGAIKLKVVEGEGSLCRLILPISLTQPHFIAA